MGGPQTGPRQTRVQADLTGMNRGNAASPGNCRGHPPPRGGHLSAPLLVPGLGLHSVPYTGPHCPCLEEGADATLSGPFHGPGAALGGLPGCQAQRQGSQLRTACPVQAGARGHCPRVEWLSKPARSTQPHAAAE